MTHALRGLEVQLRESVESLESLRSHQTPSRRVDLRRSSFRQLDVGFSTEEPQATGESVGGQNGCRRDGRIRLGSGPQLEWQRLRPLLEPSSQHWLFTELVDDDTFDGTDIAAVFQHVFECLSVSPSQQVIEIADLLVEFVVAPRQNRDDVIGHRVADACGRLGDGASLQSLAIDEPNVAEVFGLARAHGDGGDDEGTEIVTLTGFVGPDDDGIEPGVFRLRVLGRKMRRKIVRHKGFGAFSLHHHLARLVQGAHDAEAPSGEARVRDVLEIETGAANGSIESIHFGRGKLGDEGHGGVSRRKWVDGDDRRRVVGRQASGVSAKFASYRRGISVPGAAEMTSSSTAGNDNRRSKRTTRLTTTVLSILTACLFLLATPRLRADELEGDRVRVLFDTPLRGAAKAVRDRFPDLRDDVERKLQIDYPATATVYVEADHADFNRRIKALGGPAHPRHVAAVAFSFRDVIVMKVEGWRLGREGRDAILQHEIAHIVVGHFVLKHPGTRIPRWLDEGIAQWVTQSAFFGEDDLLLRSAARNDLLDFESLERSFPSHERGSALAYAQSLSLVNFIAAWGPGDPTVQAERANIPYLLRFLGQGMSVDQALQIITGLRPPELLAAWRGDLRAKWTFSLEVLPTFLVSGFMIVLALMLFVSLRVRRNRRMREFEREERIERETFEIDRVIALSPDSDAPLDTNPDPDSDSDPRSSPVS